MFISIVRIKRGDGHINTHMLAIDIESKKRFLFFLEEAKKYRSEGCVIKDYDEKSDPLEVESFVKHLRQEKFISENEDFHQAKRQVGSIIIDDFMFERFHIKTDLLGIDCEEKSERFTWRNLQRYAYQDSKETTDYRFELMSVCKLVENGISFLLRKDRDEKQLKQLLQENLGNADTDSVTNLILSYTLGDEVDALKERRTMIIDNISYALYSLLSYHCMELNDILELLNKIK